MLCWLLFIDLSDLFSSFFLRTYIVGCVVLPLTGPCQFRFALLREDEVRFVSSSKSANVLYFLVYFGQKYLFIAKRLRSKYVNLRSSRQVAQSHISDGGNFDFGCVITFNQLILPSPK
ncbi:hypothetical protein BpHYR1_018957 [Brachionus plicatilis]|uniref:Uncharacterized protein n=1 Tax=Brachionus plicatilis TaxID=10195 RepID=A0A3M7QMM3_BRAPC|nr:hypothetical protein BpHYR1_018957 [Brachionus plicatilis]